MIDERPDALELGFNEVKYEFVPMDPKTFPYLSAKERILNTYENIEHLLDFYKIYPRFNELRREIEADIFYKNFTQANKTNLLLAEITSLCNKNNVPRIDLPAWLMMIADKNAYNPVLKYINSIPWDGICRKQEFFNTIETDDRKHRDFIIERWMRGAVATGISKNGLAHHGVLTLLGDTGNGKSSWIKKLVPEHLNLLMGDYVFNPQSVDDRIDATKFWITELSEVAGTVSKSDMNALKSFLTTKIDTYRCPYDRASTQAPRKTAFAASVNDAQFLRDETGNRRWWIIETKNIDFEHTINMQQVWAQFKHEYDNGAIYYLTRDEINKLHDVNEQYRPESAIYESIMDRYRWDDPTRPLRSSATQVLYECGIPHPAGNSSITKEANRALQKITGEKPKKITGIYKYSLPSLNPLYQSKK